MESIFQKYKNIVKIVRVEKSKPIFIVYSILLKSNDFGT